MRKGWLEEKAKSEKGVICTESCISCSRKDPRSEDVASRFSKAWRTTWPRCCAFRAALIFFFWLVAAWVKSRAERPSVSGVNRQLHVQIGCKLGIRNRKEELTKQAKRNKLRIKPGGN